MNNKEFTSELSRRLGYTIKDTSELIASLLSDMTQQLQEGNIVSVQSFGTFEVKLRKGRKSKNISTGELRVSSDRKVPVFRASSSLKEDVRTGAGVGE